MDLFLGQLSALSEFTIFKGVFMTIYKKILLLMACIFLLSDVYAYSENHISIIGKVRQPLNLSIEDLG